MSPQNKAKQEQGYTAKVTPPTCGNCIHFKRDRVLPHWAQELKDARAKDYFGHKITLETHGMDKNLRCGIGGFAVKKSGGCALHAFPGACA